MFLDFVMRAVCIMKNQPSLPHTTILFEATSVSISVEKRSRRFEATNHIFSWTRPLDLWHTNAQMKIKRHYKKSLNFHNLSLFENNSQN